jgi:hypothetical protein
VIDLSRVLSKKGDSWYVENDPQCPSSDRIDCKKDYVDGNIRQIHRGCNKTRGERCKNLKLLNSQWNPSVREILEIRKNNFDIIKNHGIVMKIVTTNNDPMKNKSNSFSPRLVHAINQFLGEAQAIAYIEFSARGTSPSSSGPIISEDGATNFKTLFIRAGVKTGKEFSVKNYSKKVADSKGYSELYVKSYVSEAAKHNRGGFKKGSKSGNFVIVS